MVTTTRATILTPTIEALWREMQAGGMAGQRRVDANHPCDLYADCEPSGRLGLIAICRSRPVSPPPLSAIQVDIGERPDSRWTLRYSLHRPSLLPIFAALCQDIVRATATLPQAADCGQVMLERLQRWRTLLERDRAGLGTSELLGLIGELATLEHNLLPELGPEAAATAWKGPHGAPHDFLLTDGFRIEAKTIAWQATTVRISSLAQLDTTAGPIRLAVVRVQRVDPGSASAASAPQLVARLRTLFASSIVAEAVFEDALAAFGWHDHPTHGEVCVRLVRIDAYLVDERFPRLLAADMPVGVTNVAYDARLPPGGYEKWFSAP